MPLMTELIWLMVGMLVGGVFVGLYARIQYQNKNRQLIDSQELEANYVLKALFDDLTARLNALQKNYQVLNEDYLLVSRALSAKEQYADNLMEKLRYQNAEIAQMQDKLTTNFENIANRLLDEKSQKFSAQNHQQISNLLTPLKEKIRDFEEKVERGYLEDTKQRISLREEIRHLRDLNMQLSQDANQLVSALKGDSKTQGDWGEFQLETLLEKSGLQKGVHFSTQSSFRDAGGRQKRPDFIIHLPEQKHLIIDSKVSLKAYEAYFNLDGDGDNALQKSSYLKAHLDSLRSHIRDLSSKNYQHLYQINSPDYLLMFVPIEPALAVALQQDKNLFLDALERNIVLVTTSTLLATMRTVSYIWKQEKQKKSVLEIAKQSGLLYDKFVGFVADLQEVGKKMNEARNAYDGAMNKLQTSKKFGDTLIGRAQRIKDLGANASKELPTFNE